MASKIVLKIHLRRAQILPLPKMSTIGAARTTINSLKKLKRNYLMKITHPMVWMRSKRRISKKDTKNISWKLTSKLRKQNGTLRVTIYLAQRDERVYKTSKSVVKSRNLSPNLNSSNFKLLISTKAIARVAQLRWRNNRLQGTFYSRMDYTLFTKSSGKVRKRMILMTLKSRKLINIRITMIKLDSWRKNIQ